MIKALDDPCCREVATGLLPRLLPILITRALYTATVFSTAAVSPTTLSGPNGATAESRSLALDLLLAAAPIAHPSALRHALPQLAIAGLQTMASLSPSRVVGVMRPSTLASGPASAGVMLLQQHGNAASSASAAVAATREVQMAEVLRLVRAD